ncbi:MAG: amino acid adenylation domain-containing protein [Lachnospiraceae bacterium]|nr:amino acid adenylation domain-containing protein [Lachnospiraceae bacterium]
MKNVLNYLENSAKRLPDKIAVIDEKEQHTYAQLLSISRNIGRQLKGLISAGQPVAVCMKKSVLTLEVFFGTAYAGGFYSLIDPDFPTERIRSILETLQPAVVVSLPEHEEKLRGAGFEGRVLMAGQLRDGEIAAGDAPGNDGITPGHHDPEELTNMAEPVFDHESLSGDTKADLPLYCNFTSGSTGTPKGVQVGHASVVDFIDTFTELFHITQDDVIGNQAPFDFDVSVKDIYSAMKVGATLVIIPTAYFRFPNNVMDMLQEHKVTTLIWAVSALVLLNRLHEFMYKVPAHINKILFSGEEMPAKHLGDWMEQYPDATFVNLYGPTEVTCNCTYYRIERKYEPGEKIPAGLPYPGKEVWLMDDKGERIDPSRDGQVGELCCSGGLALCYYRNEEATKRAFIEPGDCKADSDDKDEKYDKPVPNAAGNKTESGIRERYYKTGDLAYWQDGLLYFAGRSDFQIKHNGHRIELEEIERYMNAIPFVQQSCCLYDHEKYRIVAFYTGENDKKQIVALLKEKLPEYMLPNVYRYMDELPLTKNGKIDRGYLRGLLAAPSGAAKQ